MPLTVVKADYFLADVEKQFRWYLAKAGIEVADRYLAAIAETVNFLADNPFAGWARRFRSATLVNIRSHAALRPFNAHILFYRVEGEVLHVRRVMHGARDLPRRLRESPYEMD